ncbi:MAG: CYTH domain-containing protein [Bacteroidales bacterium]|nr:CYTH domain-containing protein [Candidatus Colimorpha pelethequi]MCQ2262462.1 CYTH domain-containing protein [Bacteroidales bacterium]
MEIERKFLVRQLPPNYEAFEHYEIEQGYLCTSPTLRIRRMGDAYILTVKEHLPVRPGSPIVNREEEFDLSAESYSRLKGKCDGNFVSKTRYRIDLRKLMGDGLYCGLVAELDIFHGRHEGLRLVEVEFPNVDAANAFVKPEWFGEDVSQDPHYRNSYLSSN